jgi:flagellar brake protein
MTAAEADSVQDGTHGDERFRVYSRLEIVGFLRALVARHERVGVEFGSGDFVVTALLAVDEHAGQVVCDYGADASAMNRLLRAERLRFATQLDHVDIRFLSDAAVAGDYDDGPAFRIALPTSLLRVQRREAYRLKLPLGRPLWCEIGEAETPNERIVVRVRDISVAGLSLADLPQQWRVAQGMVFPGCGVAMGDLGTLTLNLEVMHTTEGTSRRCGCRFVDLAPGVATVIQRYITRIEREQHARQ